MARDRARLCAVNPLTFCRGEGTAVSAAPALMRLSLISPTCLGEAKSRLCFSCGRLLLASQLNKSHSLL